MCGEGVGISGSLSWTESAGWLYRVVFKPAGFRFCVASWEIASIIRSGVGCCCSSLSLEAAELVGGRELSP